jgi:hypothetical protein
VFGEFDVEALRERVPPLPEGEQPMALEEAVAYALGS